MRNLFAAEKLLLLDLASTLFFLVLYLLTKNIPLAVVLSARSAVARSVGNLSAGNRLTPCSG